MDLDRTRLIYEGGAGAHLRFGRSFFLEPGLHFASSHETGEPSTDTPDRGYLFYLVMAGVRFGRSLDVLAGAGLRHTVSGAPDEPAIRPELRLGIGLF
jgi:hypothetical protein